MLHYAIDLGTTNSVVSCWDAGTDSIRLLEFPDVSRGQKEDALIKNEHAVPTAIYIGDQKKTFFWKKTEYRIGINALSKDTFTSYSRVIKNFKASLMQNGYDIVKRHKNRVYTSRDAARIFLREIFRQIKLLDGKSPKSMTFSVPVDCYEPYRAQLKKIARELGIRKIKLIDEPVAAAVGYGLRIDEAQNILVFDFGGGTLDLAIVRIDEKISGAGRCSVIAKAGLPIGGNTIDGWLVDYFCSKTAYNLNDNDISGGLLWNKLLAEEACRIKENLFFKEKDSFNVVPPKEFQNFETRIYAEQKNLDKSVDISRQDLRDILKNRGLYEVLESVTNELLGRVAAQGIAINDISNVLLVGGSSLLPGINELFEKKFGRSKVQSWQPFNAVGYGACTFAAGQMITSDFIVHDYAFVTHNPQTKQPEYNVIVPRYTPFPTAPNFWKHQLTPTCSHGLPEKIFKLLICEIGKKHHNFQEFLFDKDGKLHDLANEKDPVIIVLNEDDPALGNLNPPHPPSNREPRLEVSFMVDEEKWLCATVKDLLTKNLLMDQEAIVRLR